MAGITEGKWTTRPGTWWVVESGAYAVAVGCKEADAKLIAAAPELLEALKQALRYIEVRTAYQGAMTAAQVEDAIKGPFAPSRVEIGANSCNTLAVFDFEKTRAAIAKAENGE